MEADLIQEMEDSTEHLHDRTPAYYLVMPQKQKKKAYHVKVSSDGASAKQISRDLNKFACRRCC
jgi:hypothetical protein